MYSQLLFGSLLIKHSRQFRSNGLIFENVSPSRIKDIVYIHTGILCMYEYTCIHIKNENI